MSKVDAPGLSPRSVRCRSPHSTFPLPSPSHFRSLLFVNGWGKSTNASDAGATARLLLPARAGEPSGAYPGTTSKPRRKGRRSPGKQRQSHSRHCRPSPQRPPLAETSVLTQLDPKHPSLPQPEPGTHTCAVRLRETHARAPTPAEPEMRQATFLRQTRRVCWRPFWVGIASCFLGYGISPWLFSGKKRCNTLSNIVYISGVRHSGTKCSSGNLPGC
jgi:hypothetical protein